VNLSRFHRRPPSARAFTLLELLAIITVIAVLVSLLAPAVAAARAQSRKATELSAARQLIVAYHTAAGDQRGRLLGRYGDARGARSETGSAVSGVSARWPHHLRPYLGDRFRSALYINEQAAYYERYASDNYRLSLGPTFGLNDMFVGGSGARLLDPPVTRVEQSRAPAQLLVFVATRARELDPAHGDAGYFAAGAPAYWSGSELPDYAAPDPALDAAYGHLAPRWSGHATVAHLDGSVALRSAASLRDMRLWSEAARRHDAPSYQPPAAP
jgi:hypothetical protein